MIYFLNGTVAVAELLLQLLPYVMFGILLSEILKYTSWSEIIERFISTRIGVGIFLASILGIFSPLATYGTVPIIVELNRKGVKPAVLITFLSASALMNPQLFIVTWGALGGSVALIRVISVFVFTIILGTVVHLLFTRYGLELKAPSDTLLNHRTSNVEKSWRDFKFSSFVRSFLGNLEYMGYYIVMGTVLTVAFSMLVPELTLLTDSESGSFLSIIGAAMMGIPLYVCGGAVIPFVQNLMESGLSVGAVIAFFIVGPATRILPMTAVSMFFNRRMMIGYIMGLISFAIVLGVLIDLVGLF